MSAREMWARQGWRHHSNFMAWHESGRNDVRVLVQEIPEGMPKLAPKDRVRHVGTLEEMEVTSRPFWSDYHGEWRVEVSKADYHYTTVGCKNLALLPPETSRLIRVTGPEDLVSQAEGRLEYSYKSDHTEARGVRVEVVDE